MFTFRVFEFCGHLRADGRLNDLSFISVIFVSGSNV